MKNRWNFVQTSLQWTHSIVQGFDIKTTFYFIKIGTLVARIREARGDWIPFMMWFYSCAFSPTTLDKITLYRLLVNVTKLLSSNSNKSNYRQRLKRKLSGKWKRQKLVIWSDPIIDLINGEHHHVHHLSLPTKERFIVSSDKSFQSVGYRWLPLWGYWKNFITLLMLEHCLPNDDNKMFKKSFFSQPSDKN